VKSLGSAQEIPETKSNGKTADEEMRHAYSGKVPFF
jgi:hypothetical protein